MKVKYDRGYSVARRAEYPTVHEFAEAMSERELGDDTKWKAYVAKCADVRKRHPKPTKK